VLSKIQFRRSTLYSSLVIPYNMIKDIWNEEKLINKKAKGLQMVESYMKKHKIISSGGDDDIA